MRGRNPVREGAANVYRCQRYSMRSVVFEAMWVYEYRFPFFPPVVNEAHVIPIE